jgi:heat shock protein beta
MDILINSLYTTRDIFLRETISNAADALDKIRFMALTQPELLESQPDLNIKVQFDPAKKLLRIIDTGIGMTKEELIQNLGVVAKSGTTDFLEAAQSGTDALSLIGQFGVGFYSVYLVADRVTVRSKSAKSDEQYIWESSAKSQFTIAKDPRGNTLGRGTEITLHLKPDAQEFLNDKRLTDLVTRYSEFINFPIYVSTKKTITEEVPVEETPKDVTSDEDVVVEDGEEKPKTKSVTRDIYEDVQVNTVKPLWTRTPSDITEEEYKEFYKAFSKDRSDYLTKNHFSAEGDITFKSLLFIPSKAEQGFYDRYYESPNSIKLYVRRVMISEDVKDLVPRYLHFVKGLVDSDDLPLNVNREMLSQNKIVSVMSKKVIRKVLDMLKNLANEEKDQIEKYNEQKEQEKQNPDEVIDIKEPERLFTKFWTEFGKSIKLGILDDFSNKNQLTRLLRFKSTHTKLDDENDWVSLDEYLERKKSEQDNIYFLTGESFDAINASPFLARAKALGVEVLLLNDPLDEYLVQQLTEYDNVRIVSLAREGVKLPGADKPNLLKQQEEDLKPLTTFLLETFNKAPADKKGWSKPIDKIVVTHRLGSVPLAIVATMWGQSAGMERIMKAQALSGAKTQGSKKTVEINPWHPVIKSLKEELDNDNKEKASELAQLLLDSALITSGYGVNDQELFAKRLFDIVSRSLNVVGKEIDAEPSEDLPAPVTETSNDDVKVDLDIDEASPHTIKINPSDIKISTSASADHDEL